VSPATLRPGTEAQTFSMHVADLSEPFTVSIGGAETTQFGRYDVDAGDLLWYFPRALIGRPGRYPVVVSTRAGASYPAYVDVLGVPRVVSVTPAEIVREKAGDGTTVRIRVVFDGSMPATARVGSDRLGWVTRSSLQLADSATAVWVDVPMEMVQKVTVGAPEQVSVVLTNEAGASTGTFAVRSDGSTLRVARPGISTPATRAIVRPPPPSHPPMVRP
jgi:hypothetical protein